MRFVTRLESAQDGDGVIDRRFAHLHWLKASLERGVFLDMLAILVEGGRADAAQFAASKRGLEQLSRADRAFALSRAHDGVQFIDEQNDAPFARRNFAQHGLEALFKLTAILRAREQLTNIK